MEALGINPVLLVAQMVSFTILFAVFSKFLYPMISKALDERRNAVKKIYDDKQEIEKKLAGVEKELAARKKELEAAGKKIEADAKRTGEEIKKEIVAKAEVQGAKELEKAKGRIEQEVEAAKSKLTKEVGSLAQEMAEKIIKEQAKSTNWQSEEINKSIKHLQKKG